MTLQEFTLEIHYGLASNTVHYTDLTGTILYKVRNLRWLKYMFTPKSILGARISILDERQVLPYTGAWGFIQSIMIKVHYVWLRAGVLQALEWNHIAIHACASISDFNGICPRSYNYSPHHRSVTVPVTHNNTILEAKTRKIQHVMHSKDSNIVALACT